MARPHNQLPKQRDIFSILTWVSAFTTYSAIVARALPARTKQLLANMRLQQRVAIVQQNLCYLLLSFLFTLWFTQFLFVLLTKYLIFSLN